MNIDEAKRLLARMRGRDSEEQLRNRVQINEAFRALLESLPDEREFSEAMSRIVLTPEMLWMIWAVNNG